MMVPVREKLKGQRRSNSYTRQDILYHQVIAEQEEKEDVESRIVFDDIFQYVGDYGKYQKLLTWLVLLPACLPCGLQGFNQLFMANDLGHWCHLPDILQEKTNFTLDQLKRLALPIDSENRTSSCLIKDVDWANFLFDSVGITENEDWDSEMSFNAGFMTFSKSAQQEEGPRLKDYEVMIDELDRNSWQLVTCPHGWDYDGSNSIVKDFDLICGREIYPTISLFLVNLGGLFGVFLFGLLSDLIGRKASFFSCLACEMFGGIGCVFATDFWTWTLFRVFVGLTVPAIYQIPFIICLELVGPSYRTFVTVMTSFFYVAGMMLLPLIAFLVPDWKLLSLYTTLPFLFYFLYIWFLPESIRWLLAQGRGVEALKILRNLAHVNGRTLPQNMVDRIELNDHHRRNIKKRRGKETPMKKGLMDLFRTPNMRLKTSLLTLCWFCNCTVYVGLSYYGPTLGENAYLSFFLSSAVELPGYFLCWLLMDRYGRRWPLCLSMLVGGAFDIGTVLLSPDSSTLMMCFYLIAKLGISASYLIIYPFAGELYPTEVRGIGLGFSAYIGGIGLSTIPLINYLGRQNLVLPLVVMGILSVVGGIAGLRLPETLNAPLSQTIFEGEEFGKNFTWRHCIGCYRILPSSDSFALTSEMDEELSETEGRKERRRSLERINEFPLLEQKVKVKASDVALCIEEEKKSTEVSLDTRQEIISQMSELPPLEKEEMRDGVDDDGGKGLSMPVTVSGGAESHATTSQVIPGEVPRGRRLQRLVRQESTFEAPTDSTGAFIITPWW